MKITGLKWDELLHDLTYFVVKGPKHGNIIRLGDKIRKDKEDLNLAGWGWIPLKNLSPQALRSLRNMEFEISRPSTDEVNKAKHILRIEALHKKKEKENG